MTRGIKAFSILVHLLPLVSIRAKRMSIPAKQVEDHVSANIGTQSAGYLEVGSTHDMDDELATTGPGQKFERAMKKKAADGLPLGFKGIGRLKPDGTSWRGHLNNWTHPSMFDALAEKVNGESYKYSVSVCFDYSMDMIGQVEMPYNVCFSSESTYPDFHPSPGKNPFWRTLSKIKSTLVNNSTETTPTRDFAVKLPRMDKEIFRQRSLKALPNDFLRPGPVDIRPDEVEQFVAFTEMTFGVNLPDAAGISGYAAAEKISYVNGIFGGTLLEETETITNEHFTLVWSDGTTDFFESDEYDPSTYMSVFDLYKKVYPVRK